MIMVIVGDDEDYDSNVMTMVIVGDEENDDSNDHVNCSGQGTKGEDEGGCEGRDVA